MSLLVAIEEKYDRNGVPLDLKLKPEIKAAWVKALRSGDYEQARGSLSAIRLDGKTGYCCLGVLAEISPYDYLKNDAYPNAEIADWASDGPWTIHTEGNSPHLAAFCPVVALPSGERKPLSFLNDIQDLTFSQIADLIEDQL
jgi:hypothetical protein